MPFRLRHLQHNFDLAPGDFLIGRDAQCRLVLDDPLVSRRHARLHVTGDRVTIADLRSRNGVAVNGSRIDQPRALFHGDRIVIGTQEMTFVAYLSSPGDSDRPSHRKLGAETLTAMPAASLPVARAAAYPTPTSAPPFVGDTQVTPIPTGESHAVSSRPPGLGNDAGARAAAAPLLSSLADKALGLGRTEEAERILSGLTADVLRGLEQGEAVPADTVDLAGQYGVRLAVATGKGKWVDYVVAVYSRAGRPFPAAVIDELHNAIRKIDVVDVGALRAYVAQLRGKAAVHGPAERFLVQRIEGLERLAALR